MTWLDVGIFALVMATIILVLWVYKRRSQSRMNQKIADAYAQGISWDVAVQMVLEGESVFIVDYHSDLRWRVVWVCDPIDPDELYATYYEIKRSGRLTSPPKELSTESLLAARFGNDKVFSTMHRDPFSEVGWVERSGPTVRGGSVKL